jgi:hypothetical protein
VAVTGQEQASLWGATPTRADQLVRGSTEPRIWTPPLVELTPATSIGFAVVDWSTDVLHHPPDPWQEWLLIHGGELLPDGRPRFRKVLVLVARQNGKTEVAVILALYWQFVDEIPMTLGTSTKLDYARESWKKSTSLAESAVELDDLHGPGPKWKREANGEQESWTHTGARYKIAASNSSGGRSLTVHRLVLDELRMHHDYSAWDASVPAGNAVPAFQAWALTNAGTDESVVLNDLRSEAIRFIDTGEGDPRLGLFEWSCPDDADPLDLRELAKANPNLNADHQHRIDGDVLIADAVRAVSIGGEALTGFKTENMCIRVRLLDPAIDPEAWKRCLVPGNLEAVRSRVAVCLDVAPDQQHATLVAAAVMDDDRVRVDVVQAWDGAGCIGRLRRDLPDLLDQVKPQAVGWIPSGPAAVLTADLSERAGWPPAGMTFEALRGEVTAVCMGLAEQVVSLGLVHSGDPLLTTHVTGASRFRQGDAWRFQRLGKGHCDAAYAAAGAVHLARTLPTPIGPIRLVTLDDD